MKIRTWTPLAALLVAAGLVLSPVRGYAGAQQEIQKQINQIEQQEAANQKKKQQAEKQQAVLKSQLAQEKKSFEQLQGEISAQGKQLDELNRQITAATQQVNDAAVRLEEAEKRVKSRDTMLRNRARLLYMNGSVSYLEVLLSSTSFSDFLDRFQNMKTIVSKDEEILAANKQDKANIEVEKTEREQKLAEIKRLLADKQSVVAALQQKEKEKQVAIASLDKQEHAAEETSEEAEKAAEELVAQKQALRKKLLEEQRKEQAAKTGKPGLVKPAYSGGKLAWPLPGSYNISSEFGYRIDPIKKVNKLHKGLDVAAPLGTSIMAADDGTVILASWVSGYGNTVVVDHDNGLVTWYAHMSSISVSEGDAVKRGSTKLGEVGSTGDSTGNHLHFEVRTDDGPQNPRSYLGI